MGSAVSERRAALGSMNGKGKEKSATAQADKLEENEIFHIEINAIERGMLVACRVESALKRKG